MSAPTGQDPDRRARLLVGGCFGMLIAAILLAALAMLLMSVAITGFYERGGDDSKPVPTPSE
ncbi:hypothetical protein ACIGHB_00715 [Streptomyces sp. NPDC085460]|uniref:hypothetical protein n=1 Tax=Streptomyces sp. NPDC085460 TaxID=3365723 RepID=UPI0037CEC4C9